MADELKTQLDRIEKVVGTLAEKTTRLEGAVDDLTAAVAKGFAGIEERMATKIELAEVEERLGGKIDGVNRRIDAEVDKRVEIETHVRKLETAVFSA